MTGSDSTAFTPKDKEQQTSFSSFSSRKSKDETNNRDMPAAFANKRAANDSRREQDEQRRQWQEKLEFTSQQARDQEENTIREALTIESEKEYPSLQNSSPGSQKKSSNNLLNFKAIVEAPASPNVPKITVVGGAKPVYRPATPMSPSNREYAEDDEGYDEEFNAHIGGRGHDSDAW